MPNGVDFATGSPVVEDVGAAYTVAAMTMLDARVVKACILLSVKGILLLGLRSG